MVLVQGARYRGTAITTDDVQLCSPYTTDILRIVLQAKSFVIHLIRTSARLRHVALLLKCLVWDASI
jgi:hypothetical protein